MSQNEAMQWRRGVVVPLMMLGLQLHAGATARAQDGAQVFAAECGRCHTATEIRQTIGGLRRLYWTDDRLAAFLLRHHVHDEAQARLIVRFLRETPAP